MTKSKPSKEKTNWMDLWNLKRKEFSPEVILAKRKKLK